MTKNVIVMDIDGCIVEPHPVRITHLEAGNWDKYHEMHVFDSIKPVGQVVYRKFLEDSAFRCVFVTGREELARKYTEKILIEALGVLALGVPLLMRPNDNRVNENGPHDTVLKPTLLRDHGFLLEDIFLVFEDRQSVVDMWRSLGITVYQTQPGDF